MKNNIKPQPQLIANHPDAALLGQRMIASAVRVAPNPGLKTRKEQVEFASRIAHMMTGHQDPEIQKLALIIETLLDGKPRKIRAMLDIELKESASLKLLALLSSKHYA